MTRPSAGDAAPAFSLTADDGSVVRSADLAGRRHVLYFYPKDETPGCTDQACGLRDRWAALQETGAEIFGISPDSTTRHVRFRERHGLPFRLLSDPDHEVAEAYGVWVEKSFRGRRYHGNERTTFVIGSDGRIEHVLARVKPAEHADLLLEALGA